MKLTESQRIQYLSEIKWLEDEIEKLTTLQAKKPSVQRQINEYKRQIQERELRLVFAT